MATGPYSRTSEGDRVEEASRESFPASDSPPWSPTYVGGPRRIAKVRSEDPEDTNTKLRSHVELLAIRTRGMPGGRRMTPFEHRHRAAEHVVQSFLDADLPVTRIPVHPRAAVENIEAIIHGATEGDELVIGARYDDAARRTHVDGDASGIAILLSLANLLSGRRFAKTVRLVAFTCGGARHPDEESAGSRAYAERLGSQGVKLSGMISLDGLVAPEVGGRAPFAALQWLMPWRNDFIAVVGDRRSRELVTEVRDALKSSTKLPVRALSLPWLVPIALPLDHRAFWREGYRAALVTDAATLRLGRSTRRDGKEPAAASKGNELDRMAEIATGIATAVARLAGEVH